MKVRELLETKHREDISVERAQELFEKHCKDSDINKPCWRGSRKATEDVYLVQGELGERTSANTSNHYTVLLDHFLPKLGYPRRSASIILANNAGKEYAKTYKGYKGGLYAIFPFDGVKIGVCDEEDIWHLRFKLGRARYEKSMESWNDLFSDAEIPDYSYEDLVQGVKETIEDHEAKYNDLFIKIFGEDPGLVEDVLQDAYGDPDTIGVHLATTATLKKYEDTARELWIGGKCLAFRENVWRKMIGAKDDDE